MKHKQTKSAEPKERVEQHHCGHCCPQTTCTCVFSGRAAQAAVDAAEGKETR